MKRLKADFHTHTGDDPRDPIAYSAEMLIDSVAQLNFDVLAIACHEKVVYNARLADYAAWRGVLLIPAAELLIEGKHVVVLHPESGQMTARTFADLRAVPKGNSIFLAPHAYYHRPSCLDKMLDENIDLFDAIEYCSFYFRGLNPNRRAVQCARRHNLPLVGTSDAHTLPYCDTTFSWIEAEPTVEGVLDAIRCRRVEVQTAPRPLKHAAQMVYFSARQVARDAMNVPD